MAASLPETVRARLRKVADPTRAPGMQAYMKSAMPYLGVAAVPLRQVCRELFKGVAWNDASDWHADVLAIWRGAQFREERYAAIELTGVKAARPFHDLSALPMYEEMIVNGAWWDYVDAIAGQRLWAILQREGEEMKRRMLAWSTDRDMRINLLTRTRNQLDQCIGCGCLSLEKCQLYNKNDRLGAKGSGPRAILG